ARRLVVAPADPDPLEPEPLVEAARGVVVGADLQEHRLAVAADGLVQQLGEQRGAGAAPPPVGAHRDGLHVGPPPGRGQARVADDLASGVLRDDVVPGAGLVGELPAEHLLAPRVLGEQRPLQPVDDRQVRHGHRPQDDLAHAGVTLLRGPGSLASRLRTESGSGGRSARPSFPDRRATASSARAPAVGSSGSWSVPPKTAGYSAAPSPTTGSPSGAPSSTSDGAPTSGPLVRTRQESYRAQ